MKMEVYQQLMELHNFTGKAKIHLLHTLLFENEELRLILRLADTLKVKQRDLHIYPDREGKTLRLKEIAKALHTIAQRLPADSISLTEEETVFMYTVVGGQPFGIQRSKLIRLLDALDATTQKAYSYFEIHNNTTSLATCSLCGREVLSTNQELCKKCINRLQEYTVGRVETFKLPINTLSLPHLVMEGKDFNSSIVNWNVIVSDKEIVMVPKFPKGLQLELPFEEYTTLSLP